MFTPGLAIFYLATILRSDHVCGVKWSRVWHKSRFYRQAVARCMGAEHHRPPTERPLKAPGRNWARALEKRHPILVARRVKALDWNRHEKNIHGKITQWFENFLFRWFVSSAYVKH